MSRDVVVILNERSSLGKDASPEVRDAAMAGGARIIATDSPEEIASIVEDEAQRGAERIIAAGGDGTVSGIVRSVIECGLSVELGVLPCGTANDLARSLGVDRSGGWSRAVTSVIEGPAYRADVLEVSSPNETRYAVNACTAGVSGRISDRMSEQSKKLWGPLAYWVAGARELVDMQEYETTLRIDDDRQRIGLYQIAIANGRYVGGGIPVGADARLDDGRMDLVLAPTQSALEVLGSLVSLQLGRHSECENIVCARCERLELTIDPALEWSVDGEAFGPVASVGFGVRPKAIRLVAPGHQGVFSSAPVENST